MYAGAGTGDVEVTELADRGGNQVIDDVEGRYPGLKARLVDESALRRFVNVYVNDEDVRFTGGLEAPTTDGDVVVVLPAVAGG